MNPLIFRIILVLLVASSSAQASLLDAVRSGDVQRVRAELTNGADIDQQDPATGETALHIAAAAGNQEIVELLLNPARGPRAWGQTLVGLGSVLGAAVLFFLGLHANEFRSLPTLNPIQLGGLALAGTASLFHGRPSKTADAHIRNNNGNSALENGLANRHVRITHAIANTLRAYRHESIVPYPGNEADALIEVIDWNPAELRILDLSQVPLNAVDHRRIVSSLYARRRPHITHLVLDANHWENSETANLSIDTLLNAIIDDLLPNLTTLRIINNHLLTRLDFLSRPLTVQAQRILVQLLGEGQLSNIEYLELGNSALNPQTVRSLAQAIRRIQLSNLVHLGIGHAELNHEEEEGLFLALKGEYLPNLVTLNLENAVLIADTEQQLLDNITQKHLPALSSLRLPRNHLTTVEELETEFTNGHTQLAYIVANTLRKQNNKPIGHYPANEVSALLELIGLDDGPLTLDLTQHQLNNINSRRIVSSIASTSRPHLTQLFIEASQWGDSIYANLNGGNLFAAVADGLLPELTTLKLVNNNFLTRLEFNNRPLKHQAQKILMGLVADGQLSQLVYLELGNTDLCSETVQQLAQTIRNDQLPNLVYLGVEGIALEHQTSHSLLLALLSGNSLRLASLNLKSTNLNSDIAKQLFSGITEGRLPSLISLQLANNPITQLNFQSTLLNGQALQILAQTIVNEPLLHLTALNLGDNNLILQTGTTLAQAISFGRLQHLTGLKLRGLGPEAGKILANAIANGQLSHLTSLDLGSSNLGPEAGKILADALADNQLHHLTALDLSNNNFGPEAGEILVQTIVKAIADGQLRKLTELRLNNNNLGPKAGRSLVRATARNHLIDLTVLEVNYNNLGHNQKAEIMNAINNNLLPNLKTLEYQYGNE